MSRRRYTPQTLRERRVVIPEHLSKLGAPKFIAVIEEKDGEICKWYVELTSLSYARLASASKQSAEKLANRVEQISQLEDRCAALEGELSDAKSEYDLLMKKHHEFVKTVVKEDGRIRVPRSQKNYLEVASERGTNFGSPQIQGGLAGLEKK
jgi:hypothetical protein